MKQDEDGNYDLAQDNIKLSYTEKCGGLNYQSTARPSECGLVGTPNVESKMTINGKKMTLPANSVMLYTQDECENTLQGNFMNLQTILDITKKTRKEYTAQVGVKIGELNKVIKMNGGEEMGFCSSADPGTAPNFSSACTGSAGILGGGSNLINEFFKWFTSFFKK